MRRLLLAFVASVSLAACASPYQPAGFRGGFTDTQINAQTFEITFGGNAFTSSTQTGNMALLRASDIALANGYPYFVVVDKSTDITNVILSTPGTAQTNGQYNAFSGTYRATTTYRGPSTDVYEKPTSRIVIVLTKDQSYQGVTYYDAALVNKSLKASYGIK